MQAYALVRSGERPAIKVGGRGQWRVEAGELEAWIRGRYEKTRAFVAATREAADRPGHVSLRHCRDSWEVREVSPCLGGEGVLGRAIEVFGVQGVRSDTPFACFRTHARALRVADGPEAVHLRSAAREELRQPHARVG